jgi:Domain of unknown function (DUF4412)
MKILLLAAVAAVFVSVPALKAETFEGSYTMILTPWAVQGSATLKTSVKKDLMRIDLETSRGVISTVVDFREHRTIAMIAQARMYVVHDLPAGIAALQPTSVAGGTSLKPTGKTDTIAGYSCTEYIADGPEGRSEIWVTDQLGEYPGLFQWVGPTGRGVQQTWEVALRGRNVFPMRVVRKNLSNGSTFRLEVSSVSKGSVPDSLFTIPDGWQKVGFGG